MITNSLIKKWGDNVNVDIIGQIKKWDKKILSQNSTTPYKFSVNKNN